MVIDKGGWENQNRTVSGRKKCSLLPDWLWALVQKVQYKQEVVVSGRGLFSLDKS